MAANENGLTLEQGQPVKTLSKRTHDFIASAKQFAAGFYLDKSIDVGSMLFCVVLLAVVVLV